MSNIIKITTLKRELKNLGADSTTSQLIVNTAELYNALLEKYLRGEKVHPYMLTGTCGQVFNQLLNLKKLKMKENKDKEEPDDFNDFISSIKNKKIEKRVL